MIPMEPRKTGCSVVEGKDIIPEKVAALANAADDCWSAIIRHDLQPFVSVYHASFEARISKFPEKARPTYIGHSEPDNSYVQQQ